ncbi:8850_t:CDS:1 [Cetraspora pellucida]|uniref:8850_t:CDS:1 n=1 Tax=Cetraspora pellucida TaxID=1433469 RepID=A0A9N8W1L9_9GLOM|nr:8850_t:CDS:1 [Cetraspora pellucida]
MEQVLTNQQENSENGLLSWVEDQPELSQKRLLKKRGKICSNACNKCKRDKKKCDGDSETKKACTNCTDRKRECKYSNVRRKPRANIQNIQQLISRMEIIEEELQNLIEEITLIKQIKNVFFKMINPSTTDEQVIELRKMLIEELKKDPENQEFFEDKICIESPTSSLLRYDSNEDFSSESMSPQIEFPESFTFNFNDLTAISEVSKSENDSVHLDCDYFQAEKQTEAEKQPKETTCYKTEDTFDERKRKFEKQANKDSKKQRKNAKGTTSKQTGNFPGISVIYPTPKGYETHKFVASENTQYKSSPSPNYHLGLMTVNNNNLNVDSPNLQATTSTADSFGQQTSANIEQNSFINQFVIQQFLLSNNMTTDICHPDEGAFNTMPR